MYIPVAPTKLTVSTPFAVKNCPGAVFPYASQYLNVLFIVTNATLGVSSDTEKSAPLSKIRVLIFEYAVAPKVFPVGPYPTVKKDGPVTPCKPCAPVAPVTPCNPCAPVAP